MISSTQETSLPRRLAFQILKNPQNYFDIAWDEAVAHEMLRLTVLSIGKKCQPWPIGLVSTTKLTQPQIAEELENADQAVNDASAHKNMRELACACTDWFRVCSIIQQRGRGVRP